MKNLLSISLLIFSLIFYSSVWAVDKCEENELGEDFCITVYEAYDMLIDDTDEKVILLDVRKPEEWFFIGRPGANKAGEGAEYAYKVKFANFKGKSFLQDVDEIVEDSEIDNPTIITICRSGDRSYAAAKLLMTNGYDNVYSVIHGFEGDRNSITGYRDVNGWKEEGRPYNPYPYNSGEF